MALNGPTHIDLDDFLKEKERKEEQKFERMIGSAPGAHDYRREMAKHIELELPSPSITRRYKIGATVSNKIVAPKVESNDLADGLDFKKQAFKK